MHVDHQEDFFLRRSVYDGTHDCVNVGASTGADVVVPEGSHLALAIGADHAMLMCELWLCGVRLWVGQ
jgi:hypothetical protein